MGVYVSSSTGMGLNKLESFSINYWALLFNKRYLYVYD